MNMKDIKDLDEKAIRGKITALRSKLRELRFGLVNRQVKNVRELREVKKDIARLLTAGQRKQGSAPKHQHA